MKKNENSRKKRVNVNAIPTIYEQTAQAKVNRKLHPREQQIINSQKNSIH